MDTRQRAAVVGTYVLYGSPTVPGSLVEQISSSLADVTLGGTRDILRSLAEAERKCVP